MPKKKEEDDDDVSSVEVDDEEQEEDEESSNDLSKADIVTKYRSSSDIVNKTLAAVAEACKPGAKAVDLCNMGDDMINELVGKIYNQKKEGKKIEKGVAFPTCISVNNCVGHYSPLLSEDKVVLADGDMVKIDMGVHVDGYVAVVAHTVLVSSEPATGRKADVIMAAWTAAEAAQRMLKDGASNNAITKTIAQVAEAYKCNAVEGVLSHQMKKHVIDANKARCHAALPAHARPTAAAHAAVPMHAPTNKSAQVRMQRSLAAARRPAVADDHQQADTGAAGARGDHQQERRVCHRRRHEHGRRQAKAGVCTAWRAAAASASPAPSPDPAAIEPLTRPARFATQLEDRTTVFKRNVETKYSLKMKASRAFFSEVNQRFPTMPFTLRAGDEKAWRMGVVECVKHDLFIEYPVLYEKPEEFVAQFKFTALLLPSGNTTRITGGPTPDATSEHKVEDAELVELLSQSTEKKKKSKPKKKKSGGGEAVDVE